METYVITKKDLDEVNNYAGGIDLTNFSGHIEAEENLGQVKFKSLGATGSIVFKAGSGLEARYGIKAGWGIEAGLGIEAGWGIEAGLGIKAGEGIEAGWGIEAGVGIEAGWGIEARLGIKAGWGIEAGEGIKAGEGIEAGLGLKAGLQIVCRTLSSKSRIFAGLVGWRRPTPEETQIRCEELIEGEICFGELVIVQKEPQTCEGKIVEVDGVKYQLKFIE